MRLTAIALAVSVSLAACGGGGGGGTSPTPNTPAATPLSLTTANYTTAGQESLSSAFYVVNSVTLVTGAQVANEALLLDYSVSLINRAGSWFAAAPNLATGATTSATEACPGGGFLTATVTDLNGNNTVDAGDSVSVTANNCVVGDASLNGGMSISFSSVTGNVNSNVYTANATITLTALKASTSAGSTTGSGALTVSVVSNGVNNTSVSLSTPNFSTSAVFGGASSSRTLSGFSSTTTVKPSPLSTSVSTSGTLVSSALGSQSISLATVTPFVRVGSATYPSSGQAIATGANGSKIRLTALNGSSVQIELDADGNGTYETSTTRAWSGLL